MRVSLPWRLSDELPISGKHNDAEVREIANCVFQTVAILIFLPAIGFSGIAYGLGCPEDPVHCDVAEGQFHPLLWAIGVPLALCAAVGAVVIMVYLMWLLMYFVSMLVSMLGGNSATMMPISRSTTRKVYIAFIAVMLLFAFGMAVSNWRSAGIAYSVGALALLLLAVAYKRRWVPANAATMEKYTWRAFGAMLLAILYWMSPTIIGVPYTGIGLTSTLLLFVGACVVFFASSVTFYILDCRDSKRQCCEDGAAAIASDVFTIVHYVFYGLEGDEDENGGVYGLFENLFGAIFHMLYYALSGFGSGVSF
jgi:hypothetical protein